MNSPALRVAWFRFRVTLGRRRAGYLTLILLIGLVGGLAMGVVGAARRTQSSFPAFLKGTNPSDLTLFGADPTLLDKFTHLPHVKRIESATALNVVALGPNGAPDPAANAGHQVIPLGSIDGLAFDMDRVTVTLGRMADPARIDEFVMTSDAAHLLGWHVGQVVPIGVYTNDQMNLPGFGTANVQPHLRINVTLVGIVVFNDSVVQDDLHRLPTYVVATPAFTRPLLTCCASLASSGFQLTGGRRDVAAVETEIERLLPPGSGFYLHDSAPIEVQAERAIKPEAIALGVFGGIAGLATLLIASQVIGRQVRLGAEDLRRLRALGADPAMTSLDALIGIVGSVALGSLLAVVVAVGLSPLAPIGPVRLVDAPQVTFDRTVLGIGLAVLFVGLSGVAAALVYIEAPHRGAERRQRSEERGSSLARTAAATGLPVPAVTGIRFALAPGARRDAVPVRSAILGAALAVIVVTGTLTFGASLHALVTHPALYGWNWNYELSTVEGGGNIPEQRAAELLDHTVDVAAWTGVYFDTLQIDGQTVPIIGGSPNAPVGPPLLSGHGFDAPDQVVLGATTLSQLHKRLGDTVEVNYGTSPQTRTRLVIVGTATMPTVGASLSVHPSIGTGALLSFQLIPADVRNTGGPAGPNAIFVRLRDGANSKAARQFLVQVVATLISESHTTGSASDAVLPVQRPAEIVNYRSMGTIPVFLGGALAAGAVVALGLTVMASVYRRRRDLALLKTLGFTRTQLASVIAWQSTVAVALGTVVGVPLGIVLGRSLWDVFANELHVVPKPSVPTLSIAIVAVAALAVANLVAAVPGRLAARTPTGILLRAE